MTRPVNGSLKPFKDKFSTQKSTQPATG